MQPAPLRTGRRFPLVITILLAGLCTAADAPSNTTLPTRLSPAVRFNVRPLIPPLQIDTGCTAVWLVIRLSGAPSIMNDTVRVMPSPVSVRSADEAMAAAT